MRVLGLIPARGGSKGVPRKNIKLLNGKPLLAYTAESALNANLLSKVILSTDDNEIARVGKELGLEVPFMRPPELAEDSTPTFPVVAHAVRHMQETGELFDAVCLLQPTSPLRRPEDIDGSIHLLAESGADSVVSVLRVPHAYNPKWVYWKSENGELALTSGDKEPVSRRQDLPDAFHRDGSVYVVRTKVLRKYENLYGRSVFGYEIERRHSANIDTLEDWNFVENLILNS
ncbi:MAG: acylneuraminate cytidylyltransferase family protein [Acidobacteria bacterium]|nr:MAG: acylneuraminate cytidylyltransferase family protein [Acidobacteriota bacterium]REK01494.1 MAG: acylneuraminate cytidylyltransferase family protein [Acidobacteriota bacterium]REK14450.1 MAG: acylneuraminate cytidylyltransferase family protein [Acidobacteriota bacterium]REK45165.1 MAG: acylneuraminate cytidylyltransferase family protein [Acidobacteriota bacterium]